MKFYLLLPALIATQAWALVPGASDSTTVPGANINPNSGVPITPGPAANPHSGFSGAITTDNRTIPVPETRIPPVNPNANPNIATSTNTNTNRGAVSIEVLPVMPRIPVNPGGDALQSNPDGSISVMPTVPEQNPAPDAVRTQ